MRISKPGKVRDHLWYLGHVESGLYLLMDRDESIIISGGMTYILPRLIEQFKEFGISKERITKLIILHAHFDHVGTVSFFKKCNLDLEIYASPRAWEKLRSPGAIDTFNTFSRSVTERMGMWRDFSPYDLDWKNDSLCLSVSHGNRIDLGNLEINILETPGHSSCSISAYIPQLRILFASDCGGIPYRNTIISSGNSNFTSFQQSLEKLKNLEVEYFCADHYGFVVGEEARNFISTAIEAAKEFRAKIEDIYLCTEDINASAKELVRSFYAENPAYFLPPPIYEGVYRQMVRHIAKSLENINKLCQQREIMSERFRIPDEKDY
jgi:glyoxylase-like metal-dependent hydrolase (beta-lactamase superfamily II)